MNSPAPASKCVPKTPLPLAGEGLATLGRQEVEPRLEQWPRRGNDLTHAKVSSSGMSRSSRPRPIPAACSTAYDPNRPDRASPGHRTIGLRRYPDPTQPPYPKTRSRLFPITPPGVTIGRTKTRGANTPARTHTMPAPGPDQIPPAATVCHIGPARVKPPSRAAAQACRRTPGHSPWGIVASNRRRQGY